MNYLLLILCILHLFACTRQEPSTIEELHYTNGIYTYNEQPYQGTLHSYFPNTQHPMQTITCAIEDTIQVCRETNFAEDTSLLSSGKILNGKKEGIWNFYSNAILQKSIAYKDNKQNGITRYYSNGIVYKEEEYKDDVLSGQYIEYYVLDNDIKQATTDARKQGSRQRKKEQGYYYKGKKEGLWHSYTPTGRLLKEVFYKNDKEDGIYITYHENGTLHERGEYREGKKEGIWLVFYDNGSIQTERLFIKGIQEGMEINYHSNTTIQDTIPYKHGLAYGVVHSYDENGKLEKTVFYDVIMEEENNDRVKKE